MTDKKRESSEELKAARQVGAWIATEEGAAAVEQVLTEMERATTELRVARRLDEAVLERPVTL